MPFNIYIQVRAPKIDADEKIFLYYIIITSAKEQSNNTVTYIVVTYFVPDTKKRGPLYDGLRQCKGAGWNGTCYNHG